MLRSQKEASVSSLTPHFGCTHFLNQLACLGHGGRRLLPALGAALVSGPSAALAIVRGLPAEAVPLSLQ